MAITVKLTMLTGPHKGRHYLFRGPTHCTVGRAADCAVCLAGDERDRSISRHHCRLDINSSIRVQDLGSLNGTYRNGHKLEPVEPPRDPESVKRTMSVAAEVEHGDMITVGESTFQIDKLEGSADTRAEAAGKTECAVVC
jgi:pSer/pThr/pTyr-binding forkhead associated (FHA) protein